MDPQTSIFVVACLATAICFGLQGCAENPSFLQAKGVSPSNSSSTTTTIVTGLSTTKIAPSTSTRVSVLTTPSVVSTTGTSTTGSVVRRTLQSTKMPTTTTTVTGMSTTESVPSMSISMSVSTTTIRVSSTMGTSTTGSAARPTLQSTKMPTTTTTVTGMSTTRSTSSSMLPSTTTTTSRQHLQTTSTVPKCLKAASTPVARHGHLSVQGNRVLDECGNPTLLKGMSLFWSQWSGQYWNEQTMRWLRDDWNISIIRAAMGVEASKQGFLTSPAVAAIETARMHTVINAAITLGIYIIVDWHDHHANKANHMHAASVFFKDIAQKFGKYPNVLFETFNEPVPSLDWSTQIKPYHEKVVSVIRNYSRNVVILGTAEWSQKVDVAAADPVMGSNLAYGLHFYAGEISHNKPLRDKAAKALALGSAIFVTEWGVCHYSGKGALGLQEAQAWTQFFAAHYITNTAWAVNNKDETCSILRPNVPSVSHWTDAQLTDAGKWYRAYLRQ